MFFDKLFLVQLIFDSLTVYFDLLTKILQFVLFLKLDCYHVWRVDIDKFHDGRYIVNIYFIFLWVVLL